MADQRGARKSLTLINMKPEDSMKRQIQYNTNTNTSKKKRREKMVNFDKFEARKHTVRQFFVGKNYLPSLNNQTDVGAWVLLPCIKF